MKVVRKCVFETNSSSQHAITVPVFLGKWQYYHDYVIKEMEPFKVGDKYVVNLKVDPENMVGEDFTTRHYIPHYSFVDKAFYVIATIEQHYASRLGKNIPYDSSIYKREWADKEKDPDKKAKLLESAEEAHVEFLEERKEYIKKFGEYNQQVLTDFKRSIKYLEDSITSALRRFLNVRDRYDKESYDDYMKTCPEVELSIYYTVDEDMGTFDICDDWFSTGCYGNEEFYYAVCESVYDTSDWLVNPYAAILAGGDEQSTLDHYKQESDAERLISEAWDKSGEPKTWPDLSDEEIEKEVEENCYTWDDSKTAQRLLKIEKNEFRKFLKEHRGKARMTPGKIIWPIGG